MSAQFSQPRPNLIVSDTGFSVEVLGRTGLRYVEGGRAMFVDSEVLATPAIAVYRGSIQTWDPPHEAEVIDESDRERVIDNIRLAIESQGDRLHVI